MFFCDTGVGLVEPYWSDVVVLEAIKNIQDKKNFDDTYRFTEMNKAYPDANVTGYEKQNDIQFVNEKDQPVAKAAIHVECDFLVTNNLKHFKNAIELKTKPKALTADSMLTALAVKYPEESVKATALAWWHRRNQEAFEDYLAYIGDKLELVKFEKAIRSTVESSGNNLEQAKDAALLEEKRRY
jgi:CRISPR/Cas system CSM-associated protein Csm5 (group 7 of RAMP superfamily)